MNKLGNQSGVILPIIIFVMVFITVSALAIANFAINHFASVYQRVADTNGVLTAEAGVEETIAEINQNDSFGGFATPQEFFNDDQQGRGTYETTVTDTATDEKEIISTAKIYIPAASTEPTEVHRVRVTVAGENTDGFAVHSGVGGLVMENSATVTNGDVYVNGTIDMINSSQIGTSTNPTNVWAAHYSCPDPADSTYPQQCSSGDPITINNTAHIYGDVCATNQTNGDDMSDSGLITGCNATLNDLPDHDRAAQKAAVTQTITSSEGSCSGSESKTWAANTHITGDAILQNSCDITIEGDVWIDGKLELNNTSQLIVADSLGDTSPVIMVDGQNGFKIKNNTDIVTNSSETGVTIITYWSTASCSPDCTDVTGVDLKNSQDDETILIDNSSLASHTSVYARWSQVTLSNNGTIGSVVGQTVYLKNSGNLTFNADETFGDKTWVVKTYQRLSDD